jgi:hypothetical protein
VYRRILYISALICTVFLATEYSACAQTYTVKGMVYDSSHNYPLESVTVLSTSGKGTVTNADGFYQIEVTEKDSIWFSYLNKPTIKFPVLKMVNPMGFDISLQVNVPTLKEVKIRPRYYRQDSIQNRLDYAKIFNYKKPTIRPSINGMGVGFDLDELINMFRFKRNRSLASFQRRLLLEEQDKFVEHRFNKALVRRLTLLESPELDSFMLLYRPSLLFTQSAGDYEFQYYIKTAFFRFKNGLPPETAFKQEE